MRETVFFLQGLQVKARSCGPSGLSVYKPQEKQKMLIKKDLVGAGQALEVIGSRCMQLI